MSRAFAIPGPGGILVVKGRHAPVNDIINDGGLNR